MSDGLGSCSALNVTAFVLIFLWVPETKQRTLEELDYICNLLSPLPASYRAHSLFYSRRSYPYTRQVPAHQNSSVLVKALRLYGQEREA